MEEHSNREVLGTRLGCGADCVDPRHEQSLNELENKLNALQYDSLQQTECCDASSRPLPQCQPPMTHNCCVIQQRLGTCSGQHQLVPQSLAEMQKMSVNEWLKLVRKKCDEEKLEEQQEEFLQTLRQEQIQQFQWQRWKEQGLHEQKQQQRLQSQKQQQLQRLLPQKQLLPELNELVGLKEIEERLKPLQPAMINSMSVDDLANQLQNQSGNEQVFGVYEYSEHTSKVVRGRICQPHSSSILNDHGRLGLHRAVSGGCIDQVGRLLRAGVCAKAEDSKKRTALHIAVTTRNLDIVRLLLDHGADPNQKDIIGNTALHLGVCVQHLAIVKLLLERGANVLLNDGLDKRVDMMSRARLNECIRECVIRDLGPIEIIRKYVTSDIFKIRMEIEKYTHLQKASTNRTSSNDQEGVAISTKTELDNICSQLQRLNTQEIPDEITSAIDNIARLSLDTTGSH